MRTEEILILILLGLLIYLNYYYQKKLKEVETQKKRVIIPISVGGKTAYDFQWYNYHLENYLRR